VWAVGYHGSVGDQEKHRPLVEHWNGTKWSAVETPDVGISELDGVAVESSRSAWAVGRYLIGSGGALVEHWDGRSWKVIRNPRGARYGGGALLAVTVVRPNDAWAVGEGIQHWNGEHWRSVSVPDMYFFAVSATARNDVWAAGAGDGRTDDPKSRIAHWDGHAWEPVEVPDLGRLFGVTAVAKDDVWAVGLDGRLHWDGRRWHTSPPADRSSWLAVAAVASRDIWAVGHVRSFKPLIEHYACAN
jgi:hypothetical protein